MSIRFSTLRNDTGQYYNLCIGQKAQELCTQMITAFIKINAQYCAERSETTEEHEVNLKMISLNTVAIIQLLYCVFGSSGF